MAARASPLTPGQSGVMPVACSLRRRRSMAGSFGLRTRREDLLDAARTLAREIADIIAPVRWP